MRLAPSLARIAALAALLLGACRPAPAITERPPFFFMQLADPQFGFFTANKDFAQETVNFEKAIVAANRLKPAFVVVCGDLVHRAGDSAQIAEYRRIARQLDPSIPLYSVPGNHDLALPLSPESVRAYRQLFGPDYFTFESHGLLGIVINTSLIKEPDGASTEAAAQGAWLRATLERVRRGRHAHLMVFQHHSFFLARPDEPDQYFNLPAASRRALLDLLEQAGVTHVFAGHYHRNALGRDGPLEMVTSGPVGKPLGSDPSGIRIVVVSASSVSHRYYALDSIPGQVALLRNP